MKTVRQLLKGKGSQVWTIHPEASVYDALAMMAEKNVGALLVVENEDDLVGIISERDHARKVDLAGRSAKSTKVKEIMTSDVIYTLPNETIDKCMALMTANRIRHLPVVSENELVGLISIGDLVLAVVSEQEEMIQQLENYIAGSYTRVM
jgi:CBS domain-containing protein